MIDLNGVDETIENIQVRLKEQEGFYGICEECKMDENLFLKLLQQSCEDTGCYSKLPEFPVAGKDPQAAREDYRYTDNLWDGNRIYGQNRRKAATALIKRLEILKATTPTFLVKEWMEAAGQMTKKNRSTDFQTFMLRAQLVKEEAGELVAELDGFDFDKTKYAKEIADCLFVLYGALVDLEIECDYNELQNWKEISCTNNGVLAYKLMQRFNNTVEAIERYQNKLMMNVIDASEKEQLIFEIKKVINYLVTLSPEPAFVLFYYVLQNNWKKLEHKQVDLNGKIITSAEIKTKLKEEIEDELDKVVNGW